MTMLAMWIDEISVALATDSQMTGDNGQIESKNVPKLHCVRPGKVMFGVGFGEGASEWLKKALCEKEEHPYPEHWRDCSKAKNVDELEKIMRCDLQTGKFPTNCHLELWIAGINEQGILRAFILDRKGDTKELSPGSVVFNQTSKLVTCKGRMASQSEQRIAAWGLQEILWQPEQRFWISKKEKDDQQIRFSGAEALKETCEELIGLCDKNGNPYIGGELRYCMITLR